jgi:hypothetical protein
MSALVQFRRGLRYAHETAVYACTRYVVVCLLLKLGGGARCDNERWGEAAEEESGERLEVMYIVA